MSTIANIRLCGRRILRNSVSVLGPSEVNQAFGDQLRAAREKAGLSQNELAAKSGVRRTTIANMELGAQTVTILQLMQFATALDVEPRELLPVLSQSRPDDAEFKRMMRQREAILGH